MTLAEWMIFLCVILYLLTIAPVKAVGYQRFDNSNPRNPEFFRPGIASRALGAHFNGIETFPFFAASVLLAEFRHVPQPWIDVLAVAFFCIRVIFDLAYLGNWFGVPHSVRRVGLRCGKCAKLFYVAKRTIFAAAG